MVPDRTARAVCSRQHDMKKANRFSQRLKRGAALADAAVGPGKQHSNAVLLGKHGERLPSANGEKTMGIRIPEVEKLEQSRAVFRTRIEIQRACNGFGNPQLRSGWPAFRARKKSIANGFQRALLAERKVQRCVRSRVSFFSSCFFSSCFSSGVPRNRLFSATPWKKARPGSRD